MKSFFSLYGEDDILFLPLDKNSYADVVLKQNTPLYVRDTSKSPYWGIVLDIKEE